MASVSDKAMSMSLRHPYRHSIRIFLYRSALCPDAVGSLWHSSAAGLIQLGIQTHSSLTRSQSHGHEKVAAKKITMKKAVKAVKNTKKPAIKKIAAEKAIKSAKKPALKKAIVKKTAVVKKRWP